jgi:hypothetical protein
MRLDVNGLGDRGREDTEQTMMALRSLERAIAGLRFLEVNAVSIYAFRNLFPSIWDDLNKVEHHLRILNNSSNRKPIFLHN